ncbi:galactokinase [bacterium]|nr:galactokinase [bacterium]
MTSSRTGAGIPVSTLTSLCSGPEAVSAQKARYERLTRQFRERFGTAPKALFSTPGRTEIGGNHTDHNHGRVLAASINLDSAAAAGPVDDMSVSLYSEGYETPFSVDISDLAVHGAEKGTTAALIRGIAAGMKRAGFSIGGWRACMAGDVLVGSGLSSSASIEVLIATVMNAFYNGGTIDPVTVARIAQFAENAYFGKPCGLMDQTACAVGGIITIDFETPDAPRVERVDFDFAASGYRLLVVDTGGNHADLTDDYASIPAEMQAVAGMFGKQTLRGVTRSQVLNDIQAVRAACGDRAVLRALHFIDDNERVLQQVTALEKGDVLRFLDLISESGDSSYKMLQNIYSNHNVREQGLSLALSLSESFIRDTGEGACRVHGGGFAGTIQVFLPRETVNEYRHLMEPVFGTGSVLDLSIRRTGTCRLTVED